MNARSVTRKTDHRRRRDSLQHCPWTRRINYTSPKTAAALASRELGKRPKLNWIRGNRIAIQPTEKYVNDLTVQEFMPRAFAKQDKPFFLYFSQTSPHEPVSPSANFKGKSGIAPIADFVMETDWLFNTRVKECPSLSRSCH